jgi:hypothetical protein
MVAHAVEASRVLVASWSRLTASERDLVFSVLDAPPAAAAPGAQGTRPKQTGAAAPSKQPTNVSAAVVSSAGILTGFCSRPGGALPASDAALRCPAASAAPSLPPGAAEAWWEALYTSKTHAAAHLPSSDIAPLTQWTQQEIYRHQHPAASVCRDRNTQFIVADLMDSQGLGALLHSAGYLLGAGMASRRIVVWSKAVGTHYLDAATCTRPVAQGGAGSKYANMDCIFLPISSCTIEHALANGRDRYVTWKEVFVEGKLHAETGVHFVGLPPTVRAKLISETGPGFAGNATGPVSSKAKYWWRAQSAAYLSRLNPFAAGTLRRWRTDPSMFVRAAGGKSVSGSVDAVPPFPLPPGSGVTHIRHGDKDKEMPLLPFSDYAQAYRVLERNNPLNLGHTLFLSSEDSAVLSRAQVLTESEPWTFYWAHIPRSNGYSQDILAAVESGTLGFPATPRTVHTLKWLLELYVELEGDAFLVTRGSNWSRLQDELRCVLTPKCQRVAVEVGAVGSNPSYGW